MGVDNKTKPHLNLYVLNICKNKEKRYSRVPLWGRKRVYGVGNAFYLLHTL